MKTGPMELARSAGDVLLILALSMVGAYASAIAFIALQGWTLPRSDLAYGQGLSKTLSDPFVMNVAEFGATLAGFVVFPIALWALHRRNPIVAFGVCLTAAIAAIATVTPFLGALGIVAAIVAVILALRWCRRHQPQVRP
jgi:hypothetical protein